MTDSNYKKFVDTAKRGIRGEAFFETLFCEHAIPHRITGPKDLGLDYLCEWVHGDHPSGVLFGAQVKTTAAVTPRLAEQSNRLNGLERWELAGLDARIDERTQAYWRGLGIPVYLFVLVDETESSGVIRCFYERTAAPLTSQRAHEPLGYYRVNDGARLLAFGPDRSGGFARDLYFDHVRWAYAKGTIVPPDPKRIGLLGFASNMVFADVLSEYWDRVARTHQMTANLISVIELRRKEAHERRADDDANERSQE